MISERGASCLGGGTSLSDLRSEEPSAENLGSLVMREP